MSENQAESGSGVAQSKQRTLFLHIGAPKTGSTSVQAFLKRNARLLARRHDLTYPKESHLAPVRPLQAYAAYPDIDNRTAAALGPALKDPEAFLKRYEATIARRASAMTTSRMLFSSELLAILDDQGVDRVRKLFEPHFDRVRVIYYIRRQDELELSAYLQAFKGGYEHQDNFARPLLRRRPSFREAIERWSDAFGRDSMIVRVYDRDRFPERNVVFDFLSVFGIEVTDEFDLSRERNPTFGVNQIAAAKILNPVFNRLGTPNGKKQNLRSPELRDFINTLTAGRKYLPARADAQAFYEEHREENEWIRREYFPELETLFDESFDSYPEEETSVELSQAELKKLLIKMWKFHLVREEEQRWAFRSQRESGKNGPAKGTQKPPTHRQILTRMRQIFRKRF